MLPRFTRTLSAVLLLTGPATALTIDFESYGHGQVVTTGVTVDNPNRTFDIAVAFDTAQSGTADDDLERGGGWSGGNLASNTDLGKILIIQENDTGCGSGFCSSPDDEGRRPAGVLEFSPGGVFESFAFSIVDIENEEGGSISFTRSGSVVATFAFSSFLGLGQNVAFGDHTANRVDLGTLAPFDAFTIALGGSGGIDDLVLREVPEPGTAALLLLGLGTLAIRRVRRA